MKEPTSPQENKKTIDDLSKGVKLDQAEKLTI